MSQMTFKDLNLSPNIIKAVDEMGYEHPSDIQEQAIPVLLENNEKDFIGQAQTGTGKTAAFVIPLLEKMDVNLDHVQALILAPTRELANQVENEIKKLSKFTKFRSTCVYGGASYDKQITALKRDKAQIVVGTPGRVIDLMKKGFLKLENAQFCILDEADEMLNMGFFEDIKIVLDSFSDQRKLIMFSATMPKDILKLIERSFNEYDLIKVQNKSLSNDDIEQKYFVVKNKYFSESLARLIDFAPDVYAIVFCQTKVETREVGEELRRRGHYVEVLNGDMGQFERDRAMRNFKERKVNLMVCTDVAARGIDVTNLTHVFNYGLPQDNESYVHRIGRTGRAGMKGKAYTIVGPRKAYAIRGIERHINKKIELDKLPSVGQLKVQLVGKELETVEQILSAIERKGSEFQADPAYEVFKGKFSHLEHEDLMKLMFTWKFNKVLREYDDLSDIESEPGAGSPRSGRRDRPARAGAGGRSRSDGNRSRSAGGRREGGRPREAGRSRDGASAASGESGGRARTERTRTERTRTERSREERAPRTGSTYKASGHRKTRSERPSSERPARRQRS